MKSHHHRYNIKSPPKPTTKHFAIFATPTTLRQYSQSVVTFSKLVDMWCMEIRIVLHDIVKDGRMFRCGSESSLYVIAAVMALHGFRPALCIAFSQNNVYLLLFMVDICHQLKAIFAIIITQKTQNLCQVIAKSGIWAVSPLA